MAKGVSGFKLDECDNSDFVWIPWSFPEHTRFPSGLDGELMHSLLGVLYQRTMLAAFERRNRRTLGQVRSSHALAAPYPYVLYSDLYDHRDFVRGVVNAGFSGLLWSPEVRHSESVRELKRRMQAVVFSAQALLNAFYICHPPWKQVDTDKNNRGEFLADWPEVEASCRELLRWRMRLLPYLYSAFAKYEREGVPPIRALVMDWPADKAVRDTDDAYMFGESLLVAPMFADQTKRTVYLPAGTWYDFWTHRAYQGGRHHEIEVSEDTIPVFAKDGGIVPVAEPVEFINENTTFDLTVYTFGRHCSDFVLYEDDGVSLDYRKGTANRIELAWRAGQEPVVRRVGGYEGERYVVRAWRHVGV